MKITTPVTVSISPSSFIVQHAIFSLLFLLLAGPLRALHLGVHEDTGALFSNDIIVGFEFDRDLGDFVQTVKVQQ